LIKDDDLMTTIDARTRSLGATTTLDPAWFHDELPTVLRDTGVLGARGVEVLGLSTFGFEVDGTVGHLTVADGRLEVREGSAAEGPVVSLDSAAFSDLVQDVASTFGLVLAGRVVMRRGASGDFVAWEPVLRAVLDARPVYEPGTIAFHGRDGETLDLERSFQVDDAREDLGYFLAEAGYLHLQEVFTEQEMAAVSAELDDAMAAATRDDGASWWARTDEGWYPSRILGFNLKSRTLQELLSSDRFRAIGELTDDVMVQRPPRSGDSAEGLHKKVGVVEGISDVSWHKDCSLGDHSRRCCSLTTGISVTGADVGSGELGVVAGSNRANVQQVDLHPSLYLPRIPLPTRTGDVTVHCSCTLHMSRPPVERERRVVYTGFDLAPRPGDVEAPSDPDEVRRARHALNEQASGLQRPNDPELFALPGGHRDQTLRR
jgi:Phytanoyl-CoA dioxygenase (PhyH)